MSHPVALPPPYPLCWPDGRPRAKSRKNSAFRVQFKTAIDDLAKEVRQLGKPASVTCDAGGLIPIESPDPGVAVWIIVNGSLRCICCDEYSTLRENVRAVGLTLEALRAVDSTWLDDARPSARARCQDPVSFEMFSSFSGPLEVPR